VQYTCILSSDFRRSTWCSLLKGTSRNLSVVALQYHAFASYGCMGLLSIAVLGLDLFLLPRMCAAQSGSFNYCIYSATAIVLTVLHYLGKGSQASSASTLLQVCCARSTHFVTSLFCCWQSVVLRTMCTGSTKPHGHIITIL